MTEFIQNIENMNIDLGIFTSFGVTDVLDILIVAFVFYKFLIAC